MKIIFKTILDLMFFKIKSPYEKWFDISSGIFIWLSIILILGVILKNILLII